MFKSVYVVTRRSFREPPEAIPEVLGFTIHAEDAVKHIKRQIATDQYFGVMAEYDYYPVEEIIDEDEENVTT